jgi:hypothetical protein
MLRANRISIDDGDCAVLASSLHRRYWRERMPMRAHRFDALARTLTSAGSRRRAVTGLLSSTLGLVMGASLLEEAEGKKKKTCSPCKKRKRGKCKRKKPDGTTCPDFGTCQGGRCRVPFCSGKNYCPITATPPECQASGAQCVCVVTSTGAPFCALTTSLQQAADCGSCPLQSHTCLNVAGCPVAVGEVGCGTPCPDPL